MAIKANLVIDQGTDFEATVDLVDGDGVAYDLTNYTTAAQMRKNYASSTSYNFGAAHNNDLGQISLTMANSITNDLDPGRYLYDVEITSPGGKITRVVEGIVTVTAGITR